MVIIVEFRYEASLREVKENERRRAEELMADLKQRYAIHPCE